MPVCSLTPKASPSAATSPRPPQYYLFAIAENLYCSTDGRGWIMFHMLLITFKQPFFSFTCLGSVGLFVLPPPMRGGANLQKKQQQKIHPGLRNEIWNLAILQSNLHTIFLTLWEQCAATASTSRDVGLLIPLAARSATAAVAAHITMVPRATQLSRDSGVAAA